MSYYSTYYKIDKKAKYKHFWKYFLNVDGPILDIGCTTGNFIQWRPENIFGIDLDKSALQFADNRGFKVGCVNINQGLCFKDEVFNAVNCSAVLEHVQNPLDLLCEIRRVLKPGGQAVVLVPDVKRYGFDYWRDYTHLTPFTKEGLRRITVDAGFKNFRIERYAFNYLKYLPGARNIKIRVWLSHLETIIALALSKDLVLVAHK